MHDDALRTYRRIEVLTKFLTLPEKKKTPSHGAKSWTVGLVITWRSQRWAWVKRRYPHPQRKSSATRAGMRSNPRVRMPCHFKSLQLCKKKRHYASKCYKKQREAAAANLIDEKKEATSGSNTDSDDAYETSQIINHVKTRKKPSLMKVLTNGQEVLWQPDTGTQRDVWDEKLFHKFEKKCGNGAIKLIPISKRLHAYGSQGVTNP